MGLLDWLGFAKELPNTVNAVSNLYTTDKARLEAQADLQKAMQPIDAGQQENNRLLILSNKLFSYGWLCVICWTIGFCFALYFIS